MFWKIYSWFITAVLFISYIVYFLTEKFWQVNVLDLVISLPSIIVVFLYAYKKIFLSVRFWQIYFGIDILWDSYLNFQLLPRIEGWTADIDNFLGFLPILPMYIALYLYAFKFRKETA